VAQTKLAWWRTEVARAYEGSPAHPVTQALMPLAAPFGIESRHLMAVIDGCQMDLEQNRYLDFANLQRYCHLVAGIVGEVAARIFGQTEARTTDYAHRLGLALQLTNIVRDIGEDAMRGRIYLPIDELQRFDVKAHELLKRGAAPGADAADFERRFRALMAFQCERALRTYDEALALLPHADRRSQKPGLMMASIYRTLLREVAADPMAVLTQRVALTPLRKFWLAWKVQALGRL
jgi:phytoene synthase